MGDKTGGIEKQWQIYELVHNFISYSIVVVGIRIDVRYSFEHANESAAMHLAGASVGFSGSNNQRADG
jgi:hypothetical protein